MYAIEPVKGVLAPLLTPLNDDLSIATDLYIAHARRMMDEGCAGIVPFSTTGEGASMTHEERVLTLWALKGAGLPAHCMIPDTGLCSYHETAELSHACLDMGCAGTLVGPPHYYRSVGSQGLYDYYARMIEVGGTDMRLYLYNAPQVTGVELSVPLVRKLHADFPKQIVGIKDASGDDEAVKALLEIKGLIVYVDSEVAMTEAMAQGAQGCITATANLNAQGIVEMQAAHEAGNEKDAALLREAATAIRDAMTWAGSIEASKACLAMQTGNARWANVRPPLLRATKDTARELMQSIERAR